MVKKSSTHTNFSQILDDSQRTIASHARCIESATNLLKQNPNALITEFLPLIERVLVVYKREPSVERIVKFVANLAAALCSEESTQTCWLLILKHLLSLNNVGEKAIRFRTTQIITEVLESLPEEVDIDDELWELLLNCMTLRTKDKVAATRLQAVRALCRLQDPSSSEDPVIQEYIRLMKDPVKEVRKAVISQIGISKITLPHLLKRTRDLSDEVRKDAFSAIGSKVDMRSLQIVNRINLLSDGLKDRSEIVRKACSDMLASWLKSKGNNLISLLKAFDVVTNEEVSELAIKEIIRQFEGDAANLWTASIPKLDYDKLSPEEVICWRIFCEHWIKMKKIDLVDNILPETVVFCGILKKYIVSSAFVSDKEETDEAIIMNSTFVLRQLLILAQSLDFADEVGRNSTLIITKECLVSPIISLPLIRPLMELFLSIYNSTKEDRNEFTSVVLELVIDAKDSLEIYEREETKQVVIATEQRLDWLRDRLLELQSERNKLLSQKRRDYSESIEFIEKEIAQVETETIKLQDLAATHDSQESNSWERVLTLTQSLLEHTNNMSNSAIIGLYESVILPAIQHQIPAIRNGGVRALGLYCLLSLEWSSKHLLLFTQVIKNDVLSVQLSAIKCLFDILLLFGQSILSAPSIEVPLSTIPNCDISSAPPTPLDFPVNNNNNSNNNNNNNNNNNHNIGKTNTPIHITIMELLVSLLASDDSEIRTSIVEGFAKLLLWMRNKWELISSYSNNILTQLILLFFNPLTEEDSTLRQCLGVFFPAFVFSPTQFTKLPFPHLQALEQVFVPTLRTVLYCSSSSMLSTIQVTSVAQFLLYFLDNQHMKAYSSQTIIPENIKTPHNRIAISLSYEILSKPDGKEGKFYPKILNFLRIDFSDRQTIETLKVLCDMILEQEVADKTGLKNILKFKEVIQGVCSENENTNNVSEGETNATNVWVDVDEIKESVKNYIELRQTEVQEIEPEEENVTSSKKGKKSSSTTPSRTPSTSTKKPRKLLKKVTHDSEDDTDGEFEVSESGREKKTPMVEKKTERKNSSKKTPENLEKTPESMESKAQRERSARKAAVSARAVLSKKEEKEEENDDDDFEPVIKVVSKKKSKSNKKESEEVEQGENENVVGAELTTPKPAKKSSKTKETTSKKVNFSATTKTSTSSSSSSSLSSTKLTPILKNSTKSTSSKTSTSKPKSKKDNKENGESIERLLSSSDSEVSELEESSGDDFVKKKEKITKKNQQEISELLDSSEDSGEEAEKKKTSTKTTTKKSATKENGEGKTTKKPTHTSKTEKPREALKEIANLVSD